MIEIRKEDIKVGDYAVSSSRDGMTIYKDKIIEIKNDNITCYDDETEGVIKFNSNGLSEKGFYKIIKFLRNNSKVELRNKRKI